MQRLKMEFTQSILAKPKHRQREFLRRQVKDSKRLARIHGAIISTVISAFKQKKRLSQEGVLKLSRQIREFHHSSGRLYMRDHEIFAVPLHKRLDSEKTGLYERRLHDLMHQHTSITRLVELLLENNLVTKAQTNKLSGS